MTLVGLSFLAALRGLGATFYVDAGGQNPMPPYTNWSTAATNIQDSVDAATNGDVILVTNGVYKFGGRVVFGAETNRVVLTNGITLMGVNGASNTMIVGGANLRCVYVGNGSVIAGFTLTNGQTASSGDLTNEQSGGGAWCEPGGVISNCVVTHNEMAGFHAGLGGGVYGGTVWNCTIISNSAYHGGGVAAAVVFNSLIASNSVSSSGLAGGSGAYGCNLSNCQLVGNNGDGNGGGAYNSTLNNCVLSNNLCWYFGGGAYESTLTNCFIYSNYAGNGGGASHSTLVDCLVVSNVASIGGGVDFSSVYNCTVVGNRANNIFTAGGVEAYTGPSSVFNSIIYSNYTGSVSNYAASVLINSSSTWPLPTSGSWNITNAPLLVNYSNDFRLRSNSPCINSGNNLYLTNVATDLAGNPRISGGKVDMGAYEFQNPTSLISYAWLQQYGLALDGSADSIDADGDGLNNFQEWRAGTNPTNAASVMQLFSPTNNGSNLVVTWQSVTNINYFLMRSLGLVPANFQVIATNLPGRNGSTSYADTNAPMPGPWFYKVGVQ